MSEPATHTSRRILEPIDRISEILFGLIMALTFTGSFSAASAGRGEVREMLLGAIGCNLAWGLVDAVMYLITTLTERGRNLKIVWTVRQATDPEKGRHVIEKALPDSLASIVGTAGLETMRQKLVELPDPPERPRLNRSDFQGALAVFLLVFFSTFPVVVPFFFIRDTWLALRISNGIAVGLLFLLGHALGRYAGHRPWRMGLSMVLLGVVLVGLTIALGG
jgi:hypothetical protein